MSAELYDATIISGTNLNNSSYLSDPKKIIDNRIYLFRLPIQFILLKYQPKTFLIIVILDLLKYEG